MNISTINFTDRLFKISLLICILLQLICIIYSLNLSFEIGDEGYAMLGYQDNQEYGYNLVYSHLLINKSLSFLHFTVYGFRILRLIIVILTSLALATGIWVWFKRQLNFAGLLGIILFANLMVYATGHGVLTYDALNYFLISLEFVFLTYYFTYSKKSILANLSLIIAGFLFPFLLFNKMSTGFLVVSLAILLFVLIKDWMGIFKFFAGILLGFILARLFYMNPILEVGKIYSTIRLVATDHSGHNLKNFTKLFIDDLTNFVRILVYVAVSVTFIYFINTKPRNKYFLIVKWILIFLSVILIYKLYRTFIRLEFYTYTPSINFVFYCLFLISLLNLVNLRSFRKIFHETPKQEMVFFLILFLIPLIVALGSNMPVMKKSYGVLGSWFAIIYFLMYQKKYLVNYLIVCALIFSLSAIFIFRFFNNPHDLSPLNENKIRISRFDNLKFDPSSTSLLLDVDSVLKYNGFKNNDYIISTVPLCGLIYLVHGRTPGMVIFNDDFPHLLKKNLENTNLNSRNTFIFMPQGYANKSFLEVLDSFGMDSAHLTQIGNFQYKGERINILKKVNII
jgi:hypothetical protein